MPAWEKYILKTFQNPAKAECACVNSKTNRRVKNKQKIHQIADKTVVCMRFILYNKYNYKNNL